MPKALLIDDSSYDADRVCALLASYGWDAVVCRSGADAAGVIAESSDSFDAILILWEIPGPPFGSELLFRCRQRWENAPVVVMSGVLDATLAARA
jgi:DNA-binding response OmpR family regulator